MGHRRDDLSILVEALSRGPAVRFLPSLQLLSRRLILVRVLYRGSLVFGRVGCHLLGFGLEADFKLLETLGGHVVNLDGESHCAATDHGATLGVDAGQQDVVGVDLERLLALAVVLAVQSHAELAVAGQLELVALVAWLNKHGRAAHERAVCFVEVAGDFGVLLPVGEPHTELVTVSKASARDLDESAALAGPTLRLDLVNAHWGEQKSGITICEHIREHTVFCVLLDTHGFFASGLSSKADETFAPAQRCTGLIDSVGGVV